MEVRAAVGREVVGSLMDIFFNCWIDCGLAVIVLPEHAYGSTEEETLWILLPLLESVNKSNG